MNRNFKVLKRNEQLERRALKVFVASYAALFVSSTLATSSVSTVGQDNIVIGDKGVSDGYQNIVTAEQGTAQGVKSIATGGNLSRDDFYLKLKQFQGLLDEKENKQSVLDEIKANIDINQQHQDILGKQIGILEETIDRVGEKSRQIIELTEQERDRNNELTQLQIQLEQAKQQIESHSPNSTGDKTVWTDFTVQLGRLSWQKLADAGNGTSGANKLANDLKQMVETDYPDFTDKWNLSPYEEIIHGYINRQGLFDSNQDRLGISYNEKSDYIGFSYDYIGGTPLVGNIMSYERNNNRYSSAGGNSLANHLEKLREVKSTDIRITPLFTMSPQQYENMVIGDDVTSMFAFYNLKQIINSSEENSIKKIAQSYTPIFYRYTDFYGKANGANRNVHSKTLLELPPVSDIASIEFIAQKNLHYFLDNTFKNELGAVHNGIVSDDNVKAFISNTDIQYLRGWLTSFYSKFYQKIDFNADDSAWLFDKDHYLAQLSKVEKFSAKLQDYVTAYDNAVTNPEDIEAQIRLVTLYNQIRTEKNDLENYYEHIQVNLKQSTLDLFNQQAIKSAQELTNDAQKLKLYDVRNEVIKGVVEAAQNLKNDVENAQKAVNAKQDEIDDIRRQITELGLTDEEQRAADLKQQKQQELTNKQNEKSSLEEERNRKQKELDDTLRQLANTDLANLGRHSISHGVQAFASGEDSIAIGTNATAQHTQAVAIGKGNLVTAPKGISLGSQNTVSGANAIAIGAYNRVAGANTVILGHNIDTTVENSVGLGGNTTLADPVATTGTIIGQKTYDYAGTSPIGTVSVGAPNTERTITNVAAGRVSQTSTDAINGSQLYALQDYINHLQLPKTDNLTTIIPTTDINVIAGQNIESVEKTTDESGAVSYTINAVGYSGGEGVQINEEHGNRIINVNGVRTGTDDGKVHQHTHLNKTLEIQGDGKNLSTRTTSTGAIQTVLNDDLGINSLLIENGGPILSKDGINANHTVIQNIAEGMKPTDAVNVRQLQKQGDRLHQRIDNVEQRLYKNHKRTNAGIASVSAMSNIPQVMLAGKSGIGVGVGHRSGQTAVSVGYSRASDNAKHIVKLSAGVDTQHKTTFGAGYMYQW